MGSIIGDYDIYISKDTLFKTIQQINKEYLKKVVFPSKDLVFKAFKTLPHKDVKVIILGQDPYPQKGYATGIAFGNENQQVISPSLEVIKNCIYKYYYKENYLDMPLGDPYDYQFDYSLKHWVKQGVLLFNSALTVVENSPGSHSIIWYPFVKEFLINFSESNPGVIYLLLGSPAKKFSTFINANSYVFKYNHPAYAARFQIPWECDGFLKANEILEKNNNTKIKWLNNYE